MVTSKIRLLIATLAALSVLGTSLADAASRKHKRHRAAPVVHGVAPQGHGASQAHPNFPANRPVWARGSECYTDEGYGRFTPCGAGRDNGP